tara:strand:+ start:10213 stop:13851 length:3639 start_codon:yes stop_codon:yes gene_type:complete
MRIAIDLQGFQSERSRLRGIGRYSFELIKCLTELYPQHEYILVANGALKDVRVELRSQLELPNVNYIEWFSPGPLDYISRDVNYFNLGKYIRTYTFKSLHVDIILITSFLEGFSDNCLTEFDGYMEETIVLSIFYDAIPLINPDLYLKNNPEFEQYYTYKLREMRSLDGLLAISHSSKKEACNYLDFDTKYVYNISSGCDESIFNTNKTSSYKSNFDCRYFILYTGASDPRKNVRGLLEAYSQLSNRLSHYKLVLAGYLCESEDQLIDSWIKLYSINPKNVIKAGYVSDQDLAELYRNCSLFVFPSFHEGFGLPILEAMSCGAPVIGSNRTSIPEIIGTKHAMFDPSNSNEIKELIERVLLDYQFKNDLIKNSISQSKNFSWSLTAKLTVNAFKNFLSQRNEVIAKNLDWKYISKINNDNLHILLNKIKNDKHITLNKYDDFWKECIASIDKTNSQIDSYGRFITNTNTLNSWKVEGPFDSSYSLSILNRCFANSLNKEITNLFLSNTEGLGDYIPDIDYLRQYPLIYSLYNKSINNNIVTDVVSRNLYPPRVNDVNGRFNLMHSYGWEEGSFPFNWINDLNVYLQGITVMSQQVRKILIDNGLYIPIEVTSLGLDHLDAIIPDKDYKVSDKEFKILHISSCFPRKGVDVLLKAYLKAFTKNDCTCLIIKTFDNPHNNIDDQISELIDYDSPQIIVIKDELSEEKMKSLIMQSSVLVAPSRGEGFGLPIGEAMKMRIPVITTNWGGQKDFCNNENSWLLDYQYTQSSSHFNLDYSYWAEPSISHLCQLLLQIKNSSKDQLEKKIIKAKELADTFKWDSVTKKNVNFVNHYSAIFNNKFSKIGWISTWHDQCGIASYSKHLIDNILDDVFIFSPQNKSTLSNLGYHIYPSWNLGSTSNNLQGLKNKILSMNITSLIIQFNFNFFDFEEFNNFITDLSNESINIIIFLHSTIDPIDNKNKKLSNLVTSFKKCNRIMVHTINDLNRLKSLGLCDNLCLFPHGILEYSKPTKGLNNIFNLFKSTSKFKLATYGFCLPNKGYDKLIKAIKILRDKNYNVKLNIFSSIYSDDYYWVYENTADLIKELNLQNFVEIDINFMSDEETLDHLSSHDLLVFPYQPSNESSSASVRHGLATFKPVLVTPNPIFSDVSDLVEYLPGYEPDEIADGIASWIDKKKNISSINLESNDREDIIKNRHFSKLGFRLSGIIKSLEINQH